MQVRRRRLIFGAGALLAAVALAAAFWLDNWWLGLFGCVLLSGCAVGFWWSRRKRKVAAPSTESGFDYLTAAPRPAPAALPRRAISQPGDLVDEMIAANRYGLLLRPQIASNLTAEQIQAAREALEEDMALVPEGDVFLSQPDDRDEDEKPAQAGGRVLRVEAALIDRYPVTNYQFQQFVDAGGYEEMALWDGEIWPGVFGFVDETGQPGPRFWRDGNCPAGKEDHPVVGVCWYEANAYARWVGKRLTSDAEWVKTGCWPMPVQHGLPSQRRFPWGDAWEPDRANVWAAGLGTTCSVTDFSEGGSVAGVYGLIGNVWEWTVDPFGLWHGANSHEGTENFRSLRGGAFDTYFESQASCQFQSGDSPLVRKRNIGFRCALGLCDLQPTAPAASQPADEELVCEEV